MACKPAFNVLQHLEVLAPNPRDIALRMKGRLVEIRKPVELEKPSPIGAIDEAIARKRLEFRGGTAPVGERAVNRRDHATIFPDDAAQFSQPEKLVGFIQVGEYRNAVRQVEGAVAESQRRKWGIAIELGQMAEVLLRPS